MQTEIWEEIPGKVGYEVSNFGKIRSLNYRNRNEVKELKTWLNHNGYVTCGQGRLNRLVAITFIHNPDNKPCVGHRDDNPLNNNADNLYWCTHYENNNKKEHREKLSQANKGNKNSLGKIVSQETRDKIAKSQSYPVKAINIDTGEEIIFKSVNDAGRNGFSSSKVSLCTRGIIKTHKNHTWHRIMEENK